MSSTRENGSEQAARKHPRRCLAVEPILREMGGRFKRIRSGLAIGFADAAAFESLRALRGGVWMEAEAEGELPFEDAQFEVAVVAPDAARRELVREVNRVLLPDGFMLFTVTERRGAEGPGYTAPEVYRLVREGFDILSVRRPEWWRFGARGHTLTVCARKKAWREHKGLARGSVPFLFSPFGRGK